MIAVPVKGTFVLTPTGFDGLFDTYTVTDVNWLVLHLHVASQLPIRGWICPGRTQAMLVCTTW